MPRRVYCLLSVALLAGCMEQPKPNPLPRDLSLYTQLGGEEKLTEIVERFAAKVAKSKEVAEPIKEAFTGADAEREKRKLVEQLGARLGGPYEARGGLFAGHPPVGEGADQRKELVGLLEAAIRESVQGERLHEKVNKALKAALAPKA